ncbi:MAG: spheroidene monooxygenase [Paracoccaceae bacterium]|nr:spheroidene monooxygenase [Paracoccaceae bacterium]
MRRLAIQAVTLSLFRFTSLPVQLWAFAQMGLMRPALARVPGIGFWKLCGSGTGEGFTPIPNRQVIAILATWPDPATAEAATAGAAPFRRLARRALESWTVVMEPVASRGRWSGVTPFAPQPSATMPPPAESADGLPLAALTRATVRGRHLLRFWQRAPAISRVIGSDPNVIFKIGVGEVPWLHQVTFSIWPDAATMAAFARGDGPHGRAIAAVRAGGWFDEELYARFRVLSARGSWGGSDPLATRFPALNREAA